MAIADGNRLQEAAGAQIHMPTMQHRQRSCKTTASHNVDDARSLGSRGRVSSHADRCVTDAAAARQHLPIPIRGQDGRKAQRPFAACTASVLYYR